MKAIFRSGRVVHVWHRDHPQRSGFYFVTRGKVESGPYTQHGAAMGMNRGITRAPRLSDAIQRVHGMATNMTPRHD